MLLRFYRRLVPLPDNLVAERRDMLGRIEGMVWLVVGLVVLVTCAGRLLVDLAVHDMGGRVLWGVLVAAIPSVPATIVILRFAFRLAVRFARQQEELQEARSRAVRLDGALLVARTAAHKVNNALSPVTGYAELLAHSSAVRSDPQLAVYAAHVLEASEVAAAEVRRLQTIIRLEEDPDAPV
jgi:uncharacterized membrane protein